MKKFLTAMATVIAVVVLALTLAGCSDKSGSIKKAFEKNGYEVTAVKAEDSEALKELLTEEQQKDLSKYEVITCAKKGALNITVHSALVFKFPSKDEIVKAYGQEDYDELAKNGFVNGNCVLFFTIDEEVINIFKNA